MRSGGVVECCKELQLDRLHNINCFNKIHIADEITWSMSNAHSHNSFDVFCGICNYIVLNDANTQPHTNGFRIDTMNLHFMHRETQRRTNDRRINKIIFYCSLKRQSNRMAECKWPDGADNIIFFAIDIKPFDATVDDDINIFVSIVARCGESIWLPATSLFILLSLASATFFLYKSNRIEQ